MPMWNWIKEKLTLRTFKSVVYFLILTAIGEISWSLLSNTFREYSLLRAIGFLVIIIAALFAAVWYLSRGSSEQPAGRKTTRVAKIPPGTQGEIFLEESPSWEEVYRGVEYLSELISKNYSPEIIVGISSGGAVVGGMLSRLLNKPLTQIVRAEPQFEETKPDYSKIVDIPMADIEGKRILLVDDITISGNTLFEYCEKIEKQENPPEEIRSAILLLIGTHIKKEPSFHTYRTNNLKVRMPWDYIKKVETPPDN